MGWMKSSAESDPKATEDVSNGVACKHDAKQGPLTTAFHANPTIVFVIASSTGLLAQYLLHATSTATTTTVHYTLDFTRLAAHSASDALVPDEYVMTKSVMRNLVSFSHAGAKTTVTSVQSVANAVQQVAVAVAVPVLAWKSMQGLCVVGDSMISFGSSAVDAAVSAGAEDPQVVKSVP